MLISPDGKWMAYSSGIRGQTEEVLAKFAPEPPQGCRYEIISLSF